MPKNSSPQPPKTSGAAQKIAETKAQVQTLVDKVSHELVAFHPNDRQRAMRAALWTHLRQNPQIDAKALTPAKVRDMLRADTTGLAEWWSNEGFLAWFLDGETFLAKLEEALERTADLINEALRDALRPNLKDLTNVLKLLAEITDRMPKRWVKEKWADEQVAAMSPEEARKMVFDMARAAGWSPPPDWIDAELVDPLQIPSGEPQ